MKQVIRAAAALVGVVAVASVMLVGAHSLRALPQRASADACPVETDGGTTWEPCPDSSPIPTAADPLPSTDCLPGEGQICSSPCVTCATSAPVAPVAAPTHTPSRVGPGPSEAVLQIGCNVYLSGPELMVVAWVMTAGGRIVSGAAVTIDGPSGAVSGTTAVQPAGPIRFPGVPFNMNPGGFAGVPILPATLSTSYHATTFACHGSASYQGMTGTF